MSLEIKKYDWIDALRGYAILLVVMCHSGQEFKGENFHFAAIANSGIYGVTLFFIVSSFALFNSYKNRSASDGKTTNLFFFIRRFFRIAPLYWIACILYIMVGQLYQSIWLSPTPFKLANILANVFFMNGLYLPAINYIPPGSWSVGDEMLFYLTIPFLFLKIKNLRKAMTVLASAILYSFGLQILLYFVISEYTSYSWLTYRGWVFYLWFPNQFPVFCFGMVLFFFISNNKINYKEWMLWITVAAFLLLSFVPFDLNFPYFLIQPEYIYAAILFAFAFCLSNTKLRFMIVPINKLGKVSFSAYLIHFIIVEVGLWLSGIAFEMRLNRDLNFCLVFVFTTVITYFLSKWTYQYIEQYGILLGENLIEKLRKESGVQVDRVTD